MRAARDALALSAVALLALVALWSQPVWSQGIAGSVFEDRDGDGIHDVDEPALEGVSVRLFGRTSGGTSVDESVVTGIDGGYVLSPGEGCYLVGPVVPGDWRASPPRRDGFVPPDPDFPFPVGRPRYSHLVQSLAALDAGSLRYTAMGDSIAWNFNFCSYPESFWYANRLRDRLACTAPGASVSLDQAAIKGEHTDDLLVDDPGELNNVFRVIETDTNLITISMIGNDLLGVDPGENPTQDAINRAVAEVLDSRANLQEALSVLVSELPAADIALNTLYDNETYDCYSGDAGEFHRVWLPIVNRVLRDLAWGQVRRVAINEVAAEFAHEDLSGGCEGFDGLICRDLFQLDLIHPTNEGYSVILEQLWETAGGVSLGTADVLGRTAIDDVDYGFLRRVRRLSPRRYELRNGADVENPSAALDAEDGGLAARIGLGAGSEEFRLGGFPDWYDEIRIVRVIAGVRYRTSGIVVDDVYRIEASPGGQFRPDPGFAYSPTAWNFYTPLVGGGGPSRPVDNADYPDAHVLVLPEVPTYREVSATLTRDPVLSGDGSTYDWPPLTHEDLAQTEIRVVSSPLAVTPGNDAYRVELDHAWLDLYGWENPRPGEVTGLAIDGESGGSLRLSFDPLTGAERYNVYTGRLASVRGAVYDHGTGSAPTDPQCDATTTVGVGGRLETTLSAAVVPGESAYFLITAHVDDVESPAGHRSDGEETDRSQSSCR